MDPRRAAEALRLLRPRMAVPIHWGTLAPVWASRRRPPPFLTEPGPAFAREAQRLAGDVEVHVLSPGQSLALRRPAGS
jgi:L-ascorbate metabolism protein UlaG (beta-lactamase superfamily)